MSKFEEIRLGQSASLSKTFDAKSVSIFAEISGDDNPLHTDDAYAKTTHFGRCIVHGTFYTAILGTILGTKLPGEGTILVGQDHKFRYPVYVGDTITAKVEVVELKTEKKVIKLALSCINQDGKLVLEGFAFAKKMY